MLVGYLALIFGDGGSLLQTRAAGNEQHFAVAIMAVLYLSAQ